jgi:DNA-binding transcriptional regulator YiaG
MMTMTSKQAMDVSRFSPAALAEMMDMLGVDAHWVAEKTGTSPASVAQWMTGITRPRPSSVKLLALVLKCEVADLMDDE